MENQDLLKRKAAEKAVEFIKSGMVLGFGTGSTFNYVLEILGEKILSGEIKNIVGVPSSERTEKLAKQLNIPVSNLIEYPKLDLTIDGADEVDSGLNLIKGGGGAHLREKIIAQASKKYVIIVDKSKLSENLGEKWAVPIEVVKMAFATEAEYLKSLGAEISQRNNSEGKPFETDEGNFIIDANFGTINNPKALARKLEERAGIIEHGLFIDMADFVVVAEEFECKILEK